MTETGREKQCWRDRDTKRDRNRLTEAERHRDRDSERNSSGLANKQTHEYLFVCWFLNDTATCQCISGTDLLRQLYVLSH